MSELHLTTTGGLRFATAGKFVARNRPVHPRRRLDSHVLLIGCAGEYPIAQGGVSYVLGEGDFMLLIAGEEHYGTVPASEGQSHLWCHFYADAAPAGESELVLPTFGRVDRLEPMQILFRQLIDASCRNYTDPRSRAAICDAYVRILLTELSEGCRGCTAEVGEALAARVAEWIRLHATEGITPRDVAEQFGYSGDYLTKRFRQATGMTVGACINRRRLEAAKQDLINTDLRVGEIAARAGFGDEKYFMKVFRQYEQVTPTEYRQSYFRVHMNTR